jgi:hypothetical protein
MLESEFPAVAQLLLEAKADLTVKGHEGLPGGGHQICPLTVTRSAR